MDRARLFGIVDRSHPDHARYVARLRREQQQDDRETIGYPSRGGRHPYQGPRPMSRVELMAIGRQRLETLGW